jgi:hypothetical protein
MGKSSVSAAMKLALRADRATNAILLTKWFSVMSPPQAPHATQVPIPWLTIPHHEAAYVVWMSSMDSTFFPCAGMSGRYSPLEHG